MMKKIIATIIITAFLLNEVFMKIGTVPVFAETVSPAKTGQSPFSLRPAATGALPHSSSGSGEINSPSVSVFEKIYTEIIKPRIKKDKSQVLNFYSGENISALLNSTNCTTTIIIDKGPFGYERPLSAGLGDDLNIENTGEGVWKITFNWQHPDDNEIKPRTVWFVEEEVSEPLGVSSLKATEKLIKRGCDIFGTDILFDKGSEHALGAVTGFPVYMENGSIVITDNPRVKADLEDKKFTKPVKISQELAALSLDKIAIYEIIHPPTKPPTDFAAPRKGKQDKNSIQPEYKIVIAEGKTLDKYRNVLRGWGIEIAFRGIPDMFALAIDAKTNKVLGCAGVKTQKNNETGCYLMHSMFIEPDYRNNGIALNMKTQLLKKCIRRGMTKFVLRIHPANTASIDLNKKMAETLQLDFKQIPARRIKDRMIKMFGKDAASLFEDSEFVNGFHKHDYDDVYISVKNIGTVNIFNRIIAALKRFYLFRSWQLLIRDLFSKGSNYFEKNYEKDVKKLKEILASSTGENFKYDLHKVPYKTKDMAIHQFELPYGGNLQLIEYEREGVKKYTMVESGCGIYYEDILKIFNREGINPKDIEQILITHYDVDHAGSAGYFAQDFGIPIWTHGNSPSVMKNRLPKSRHGREFTEFINELMGMKKPTAKHLRYFSKEQQGSIKIGGIEFNIIGRFKLGEMEFKVLENIAAGAGGTHTADTVYFYNPEDRTLFAGDSSSHTDIKAGLLHPKREDFLLTLRGLYGENTSANKTLMYEEMYAFKQEAYKKSIRIFSGHGKTYLLKPTISEEQFLTATVQIRALYHEFINKAAILVGYNSLLNRDTKNDIIREITYQIDEKAEKIIKKITDLREEAKATDIFEADSTSEWLIVLESIIKDIMGIEATEWPESNDNEKDSQLKIKNAAAVIRRQIEDCISIIKNQKLNINKKPCLINDLLIMACAETKIALRPETDISKNFIGTTLPDALADPDKLTQVFINIITNSIEAMEGEGKLSIEVSQENDAIVIKFTDNGPGIEASNLKKIFQPSFSTKVKGTGLGLAISKKIIEAHGGKIEVQSKKGQGATFIITLPITNELVRSLTKDMSDNEEQPQRKMDIPPGAYRCPDQANAVRKIEMQLATAA